MLDDEVFLTGQTNDTKVLIISVAARLAGMHPQTLRQYDRMGLVQPGRATGGGRRYSTRDVAMLREIQRLSQEEGVNLAGIKRVIELEQLVLQLQHRLVETQSELLDAQQRLAEVQSMSAYPTRDLVPLRDVTRSALMIGRSPRRPPEQPFGGRAIPMGGV